MTTDLISAVDTRQSGTHAARGSERIDTLDILRGVALLGMILIHFSLRVTEEGGGARFSSGTG
ncbi:MAG TPA: heparan-alpha-glucosaminide N-acetyltransferase domain-containing protein [Longimicrobiales bacterium]|nr:heparan-alpha-glucosaminide N-acetyltransferase domain-containing protein [Longimicrobiales bacterium]